MINLQSIVDSTTNVFSYTGVTPTAAAVAAVSVGLTAVCASWLLDRFQQPTPISVPIPKEADQFYDGGESLENPSIQDPNDPMAIVTYDKVTHRLLGSGHTKVFSEDDVRAAVERSRTAQKQWKKSNFKTRRQLLRLLQDYITKHQREICVVASRETGKTMVDGAFGEVLTTCEKIAWTLKYGENALKSECRPTGVMGAIIPWNYPFHNMYGQIISALFAGNGIVLKVSEYASWSSQYYVSIVHTALESLGYSPDLVQIVTGFGLTGAALVNGGVDKLVFIGSPGIGKVVMRTASETLTPVVLELGGKDAAIVCEDCDFNQVVNLALRGTFQNCGQNCIGLERMIIHKDIYDKFVEALAPKIQSLRQGNPLTGDVDCGAMTMGRAAAEKLEGMVCDAVNSGARLLAGGHVNKSVNSPGGFFQPTLLVDVTPEMYIAQEETFGPIMTLMRAEDDNDAIQKANGVCYGLGSSVFSKDYARAEKIAHALATGMCNINDYGVNYLCQSLPFGGIKLSGFDRFAGVEGLRGCCHMRSVTTDKFYGIRTDIPPPLQYPLTASGFEFCQNLVNLFYNNSLIERSKAAVQLAVIGATEKKPQI